MPDGTAGQVVDRIVTEGDDMVRFDLVGPYIRLHKAVAGSEGLFMTSKDHFDSVGEDGHRTDPVGTGPYQFVELRSANTAFGKQSPTITTGLILNLLNSS